MIVLMTAEDLEKMRTVGRLAARLLDHLAAMVQPGVSTQEINDEAESWTQAHGARSAPLGYFGFPRSICTSVNAVVCHGIPATDEILQEGDILNIDVTPILQGYHGDASRMFVVGQASPHAQRLIRVTEECLQLGIEAVKPGGHLGDIGAAIQEHAEAHGFSVVRDFVGHGIGRKFHMEPQVFHYGKRGQGRRLKPGMVFTIEPMINEGTWQVETLADQWTVVTRDLKLSAQVEHTVAVTREGVEILTLSPSAPTVSTRDASLSAQV